MTGSFSGDTGVFEGADTLAGRSIRVRFTWSGVTTPTPRWEQAFSDDGGRDVGDELDHGLHEDSGGIVSALERAVGVSEEYRHVEKIACPEPSLALDETVLKWYDIAPDDAPVPLAVRALARRSLRDASRAGMLGDLGELGFVVLHRCGESFYFLLVCTWRNENELWETVWAKDGDGDVFFRPWPIEGAHRPTFCVWELGAVCSRTAGMVALPLLAARRDGPARLSPGHV